MSNYNNYNDNHNLDYADEIFEESENRLHAQKAVLALLMK